MKRSTVLLGVCGLYLILWSAQPVTDRASTVFAQSGGSHDLSWHVTAGGGTTFSAGGSYSLGGTLGQAGAGRLAEGAYALIGGFWAGVDGTAGSIYLPLVVR